VILLVALFLHFPLDKITDRILQHWIRRILTKIKGKKFKVKGEAVN